MERRDFLRTAGILGAAAFLRACGGKPTPTERPETAIPQATATLTAKSEVTPLNRWLKQWPQTSEDAAAKFGGKASQWQRNPEWPDTRTISNPSLNVPEFVNREWRPTDSNNLPFNWPKTAKEAVDYFFHGQNLDPRFIQPAWVDPKTGLTTGWHLSEDHWLVDGSPADVTLFIHSAEVAEGYTVNGTLDPTDDRNWVAFGGFKNPIVAGQAIWLPKGQGMTVWMPGTDPNAIALRMEPFPGNDTPHYRGPGGEQLGPDAIGFDPVYPANLVQR